MMKKEVYPSAEVKPYHDKFVWAYLDADDESNAADAEKYGVSGIPHIQFLDKNGNPVDKQVGSSSPEEFASTLKSVLKKTGGPVVTAAVKK
jgi:thioredoxin-related protein